MARLPIPGKDSGTWGGILNDFLSQAHKSDGLLKDNSVTSNTIAPNSVTNSAIATDAVNATSIVDGSITEALLDTDVQAKLNADTSTPDATDSVKGKVQLAGDLTGTADAPVIAEGVVTSEKIADGTIVSGDISPSAGIVKTQLSTEVQASLDKADTALQSAVPGTGTISGFPLRKTGETIVAVPQELADARASASSPAGAKNIVLAESWGKPGILKHIWIASGNTWDKDGFLEQGGIIRIYTDDADVPAVSMNLGDFFFLANHSDVFSTPRVGRTNRGDDDQSSAYRYLHMPFQKYLRVEVENTTESNTVFYGQADYSTITNFADLGSQQLAYTIKGAREEAHSAQTPMTICDMEGSGQVESLMVSFAGVDGDSGVLEGNIEVYIDGEQFPSWSSSGMEDAFNGGWYTVPVGGYPAGRSGNSDQTGEAHTLYRFFVDDPIFFSSHIKVVMWAGQPNQASVVSETVNFAGYAGIWLDTPVTPNYKAVDTTTPPILDDQMDQAAGSIDSGSWHQDASRTQAVATGNTFTVPYGSSNPDEDVRLGRLNVALPTDYWLETRLRVTDASHDNQEVHLILLGATPSPWFGSAVHIQLRRYGVQSWGIVVRDDFDTVFSMNVGNGRDLTNMWVRMAVKKDGTDATVYYSFNDSPSAWIPVGKWKPSKTETGFGVGSWTAGAEFDYLVVRPLESVTS